jgi:hypothetical protein
MRASLAGQRRISPRSTRAIPFCWPLPLSPHARNQFFAFRYGERTPRPSRELIGIIVKSLRQAPIRQRMARRPVRAFSTRIGERPAAFAFEIRNVGLVHFEMDGAVDDQPEHETVRENAGAAEHAFHRHRSKLREQVADEFGVQDQPPQST